MGFVVCLMGVSVGICGGLQCCPNCECRLFIIDKVGNTIDIVEDTKHIVWVPLKIL